MRRLGQPQWWLPAALLLLAAVGALLIIATGAAEVSDRDRSAYGHRFVWQSAFDALSTACGCGLLTYDSEEDYTPGGRWLLLGIGVVGATLYLLAAWQLAGGLHGGRAATLPSFPLILAVFGGLHLAAIIVAWASARAAQPGVPTASLAWNVIATGCSLGWLRAGSGRELYWLYALLAFVVALGWPVWFILRYRRSRPTARSLPMAAYALFLVLGAWLMAAFETPRGPAREAAAADRLAGRPPVERFQRGLAQLAMASGAGTETEQIQERGLSEGSKIVLCVAVLFGSLSGSPGGGVGWVVLMTLLAAGAGWSRRPRDDVTNSMEKAYISTAAAFATSLIALALCTTLGLLLIETLTASPYQVPPTFADALLDGCSAVAGANISGGLTTTVTGANLSRGVRRSVDLYQYGMTWLMLAMFAGRILPVLVLGRLTRLHSTDTPDRLPLL